MTEEIFDVKSELFKFKYQIYNKHEKAQKHQRKYFLAARTIQTWYRGYAARKNKNYLSQMATVIQKYFRRYMAQIVYFHLLQDTVQQNLKLYYNSKALIVQKTFRGYQSRKNIFDYYKLKKWIKLVAFKNEELKRESDEHMRNEYYQMMIEDCKGAAKLLEEVGIKVHHLLRTNQVPGIYSRKTSNAASIIEKFLAALKFRTLNEKKMRQKDKYDKDKYIEEVNAKYARTKALKFPLKRCEEYWRYRKIDLAESEPDQSDIKLRNFVFGAPKQSNPKSIFSEQRYAPLKWSDMMRVYGSGCKAGGNECGDFKDFNLSTHLPENKPELVEEYLLVLTNFCRIHNIVMK